MQKTRAEAYCNHSLILYFNAAIVCATDCFHQALFLYGVLGSRNPELASLILMPIEAMEMAWIGIMTRVLIK